MESSRPHSTAVCHIWVRRRESSDAKVMQATAVKRNPLLPFSHTFGLNTVFTRFIARALIFFNQTHYGPLFKRALIQARALVVFKVKLAPNYR